MVQAGCPIQLRDDRRQLCAKPPLVRAPTHLLVTEGLGVKHLRLIIGNSMGGMQAWMWAETWPGRGRCNRFVENSISAVEAQNEEHSNAQPQFI